MSSLPCRTLASDDVERGLSVVNRHTTVSFVQTQPTDISISKKVAIMKHRNALLIMSCAMLLYELKFPQKNFQITASFTGKNTF